MAKNNQDTAVDSLTPVTDRLRLLATRSTEMWWDIGQSLDEVATRMLSQNLGYPDYTAYAREVLGIDAEEARRLRRVAHHFSREVALRFGAQRLDLLLCYLEASHDTHWGIDPLRLELCCTHDTTRIAFAEATADDVRMALEQARQRRAATDPSFPPDVARVCDRLTRAVAPLGKDAPKVKVHRDVGSPEEYSLAVVGLDPGNMAAVGKALIEIGKNLARAAKERTPRSKTTKRAARKKPASRTATKASKASKASKARAAAKPRKSSKTR